jgi:hypothetical protein
VLNGYRETAVSGREQRNHVFDSSFMNPRHFRLICFISICAYLFHASSTKAQPTRLAPGHVPPAVAGLASTGRLSAKTNLYLVIGLPLRNQNALTNLMRQLCDPADPNFRHWLTPEEFTAQFGPTEQDYQKVIRFAQLHGFKVTGTHPNRTIVDVTAPVLAIEQTFQVHLREYPHPTEHRKFYAPDSEPMVPADLPVLHVAGLDNYSLPRPLLKRRESASTTPVTAYATGSGPGGDFTGKDFRAAYASGVTNTGLGQYIAIVDVGGPYYPNDIYMYETNAGFSTNIAITNILLSGWTGIPTGTNQDDGEETLDIDMALSMAPGATILNYEGEAHDVFNRIATDNLAKQITMSYGFGIDANINQMFIQFVMQGQAFFQASGDGGADPPGGTGLTGELYATIVGGTSLTTTGPSGPWQSETTWGGSGGGTSGYGIPAWQQGVSMSANQGSTINRNYPDVAMLADVVIWWYLKNGQGGTVGGTSASSPQWAGFLALANEAAAAQHSPPIGFLNPVVYAIGKGPYATYANSFHDISTGNNFNSQNPTRYPATLGYDLCTGWGSPRGSNTIAALLGFGTNDFTLTASEVGFTVVQGGVAACLVQVAPMNRFSGNVSLAMSGLPSGVTSSLNPTSVTTNQSLLTLSVSGSTLPGSYPLTLTASAGGLTHTLTFNLTVTSPIQGETPVALSGYFNRAGIWNDGASFAGGLDGVGSAYSANLLGPRPSLRNMLFALGPANANDVIVCSGQTIPLPAGQYSTLQMLVTAVNGNQLNQTFTVTYTDNSTSALAQSYSDWFTPADFGGESMVAALPYRNNSNGTKDYRTFNLYAHALTLNQTKTVRSITLPSNGNLLVLAMNLVNAPASATLAGFYNRAGMYTDGTTFTNPATGGLDGGGSAYSATLLRGAQFWNGVQFNFGPPDVTNVISCAGQTVPLPAGNFLALRMLATGVQGNQSSQSFLVTYADGSTAAFGQSLSDWFTPQNYPGEAKAVIMGHRNSSNGSKDNRTFYLYGYSFNLNSSKIVQSLRLPSNGNIVVTSVSLVPNLAPSFMLNPFAFSNVVAGQPYGGTIATNASDLDGDTLTFAKVSGPSWLSVAGNGGLSGTPLSGDVGPNSFVVSAADAGGLSNTATMNITVIAAPPIQTSISPQLPNIMLSWTGGIAPYQVQMNTDLTTLNWVGIAGPLSSSSLLITPTNSAAFYRVIGQ